MVKNAPTVVYGHLELCETGGDVYVHDQILYMYMQRKARQKA